MDEYDLIENISENLQIMMKKRDISQTELSKLANVERRAVNRYANGKALPSLKNLLNICHVLDVSIEEVVDMDELIE